MEQFFHRIEFLRNGENEITETKIDFQADNIDDAFCDQERVNGLPEFQNGIITSITTHRKESEQDADNETEENENETQES